MPDDAGTTAEPPETSEQDQLEASTRRWMWAGLVLMGLFALSFPVYRLYEPAQRADARDDQNAHLAAEGADLYEGSCASCHGVAGSGATAPAVGAKEFLRSVDDSQIRQLIAVGVPGSEMVAYSNDFGGPMTSQEIRAITAFIRSLEEDAVSKPNWRTPLEDEDLSADELYLLACSRCHGSDRKGEEDVAPDISETSEAMKESDSFVAGRIADGYRAMPRFGNVLTDDQITSLVNFLRFGTAGPPSTTTSTTTTQPGADTTTVTTVPDLSDDEVRALGQEVWEVTAGGVGCQGCHGADGTGTPYGPDIIGASRSGLVGALDGGVPEMDFAVKLTPEEIDAVVEYMRFLTEQASG